MKIYRDLVTQNVEPVRIISTLANQFRLLHEVKYLVSQKMNAKEKVKMKRALAPIDKKMLIEIQKAWGKKA